LLTSLVWRRKLPGYGGHLIAAFHFQAAIFGALTLFWIVATLVPSDTATTIANFALLIYVVWYGLTAYGRIFNEPRLRTALKSFLVLVPYFFCFFLTGMAILFYTVWRM
jgi:hypothetical protein